MTAPNVLAARIVSTVRQGTRMKADGVVPANGPMISFEEWATSLIADAVREAEQRGQEEALKKMGKGQ